MTKLEKAYVNNYNRSNARSLRDVYTTCSNVKERAFDYCCALREKLGGWDMRVTGANTFIFTCAFQYYDEDGKHCLMYITPSKNMRIEL